MAEFEYVFEGDSPKVFRDRVIKPGDVIKADEHLVNGHFSPKSAAAKRAHAEYEAAERAKHEARQLPGWTPEPQSAEEAHAVEVAQQEPAAPPAQGE